MRILLIGGTLFIGKRLVNKLLEKGHDVTLLHRKSEHPFGSDVRSVVADRNDAASMRTALAGLRFDAACDLVYDWERGTTGQQVEASAKAVPGDLARYIFMSSIGAYGDGLNHREDDELARDDHPNVYVRNKSMSEQALFRMHRDSGFPAVTLRPPFVFGPGNPFYREAFFWDRIRKQRPVIVPGHGERLMQFIYVDDLVDACCRAIEYPAAMGLAFNVAYPNPLTQLEWVNLLAAVAGKKVTVVPVPRDVIERNGGTVSQDPLYFGQYYDLPPITEIVERLQRVLHVELTPVVKALQMTYEWYLGSAEQRQNFSFEDKLISEAKTVQA